MAFGVTARVLSRFAVQATAAGGGSFFTAPGSNFPDKSVVFTAGTTANQINKAYIDTLAVTNGGNTTVDLTACTYAGTAQVFAAVKLIQVALTATTTADTNPNVAVGPQGVANGAILCFGATTGSHDVRASYQNEFPAVGWAVTAGNKVVKFTNNGTYPINIAVMFLGSG